MPPPLCRASRLRLPRKDLAHRREAVRVAAVAALPRDCRLPCCVASLLCGCTCLYTRWRVIPAQRRCPGCRPAMNEHGSASCPTMLSLERQACMPRTQQTRVGHVEEVAPRALVARQGGAPLGSAPPVATRGPWLAPTQRCRCRARTRSAALGGSHCSSPTLRGAAAAALLALPRAPPAGSS